MAGMNEEIGTLLASLQVDVSDAVKNLNKANSSFDSLENRIDSFSKSTINSLSKINTNVISQTNSMRKNFTKLRDALKQSFSYSSMNQTASLMTAINAQTKILVNSFRNVGNAISDVNKKLDGTRKATIDVQVSTVSWLGKVGSLFNAFSKVSFQIFIIEQGVRQIYDIFSSIVAPGFQFASSMETLRIGMAGILASTTKIGDAQTTYSQGLEISEQILKRMQVEALRTTMTVEELAEAYQSTLGGGINAGMDLEQIMDLTVAAANAVKSFGLPKQQVIQELRGLISGEAIRPGVDMLGTVLGYTTATVNKLREEGTLYEDIMKRMEGFKLATYDLDKTWAGMFNNLVDGFNKLAGSAVENLFNNLKSKVSEIRTAFYTLEKESYSYTDSSGKKQQKEVVTDIIINNETQKRLTKLYDTISTLIDVIYDFGKSVLPILTLAFDLIVPSVQAVLLVLDDLLKIVGTIASNIVDLTVKMTSFVSSLIPDSIKDFVKEFGGMVVVVSTLGYTVLSAITYVKTFTLSLKALEVGTKQATLVQLAFATALNFWNNLTILSNTGQLTTYILNYVKASKLATVSTVAWNVATTAFNAVTATARTILGLFTGTVTASTVAQKASTVATTLFSGVVNLLSINLVSAVKSVALFIARLTVMAGAIAIVLAKFIALTAIIGGIVYVIYKACDSTSALGKAWLNLKNVASGVWDGIGYRIKSAFASTREEAEKFRKASEDAFASAGNSWEILTDDITWKGISSELESDVKNISDKLKGAFSFNDIISEGVSKDKLPKVEALFPAGKDGEKGGKGSTSDLKTRFSEIEKFVQSFVTKMKDAQKDLDDSFKKSNTSIYDYYSKTLSIQKSIIQAQIDALDEKIAISTEEEQIAKLTKDREKLVAQLEVKESEVYRNLANAYREYYLQLRDINLEFQKVIGNTDEVFKLETLNKFSESYKKLINEKTSLELAYQKAVQEGNSEQASKIDKIINDTSKALEQQKQLIEFKKLENDISNSNISIREKELELTKLQNKYSVEVANINDTEFDAEIKLWDYKQKHMEEYIKLYAEQIALYEKYAEMTKGEVRLDFLEKAEEARNAIREITNEISPLEKLLKTSFRDSLAESWEGFAKGEKTAKEAMKDFRDSIGDYFLEQAAESIATDITSALGGLFGFTDKKKKQREEQLNSEIEMAKQQIDPALEVAVNSFQATALDFSEVISSEMIPSVRELIASIRGDNVVFSDSKAGNVGGANTENYNNTLESARVALENLGLTTSYLSNNINMASMDLNNAKIVFDSSKMSMETLKGAVDAIVVTSNTENSSLLNVITSLDNASVSLGNFSNKLSTTNTSIKGLGTSALGASEETEGTKKVMGDLSVTSIPSMIAAIGMVTGSDGLMKFAQQLQVVFQVLSMISMASGSGSFFGLFAEGGYVKGSGSGTGDSIPARISPGEYVMKASAVRKLGVGYLNSLNNISAKRPSGVLPPLRFAEGGYIGKEASVSNNRPTSKNSDTNNNLVLNMYFQSLDPSANVKMMEQQMPYIKSQVVGWLNRDTTVRNATKGAVK